jgi:hypothetical protein
VVGELMGEDRTKGEGDGAEFDQSTIYIFMKIS